MQQPQQPGNPMWDVKYPEPIAKQIKDGLDRRDALGWAPASYEQGLQVMFLLFGGWPAWKKLNEPAPDLSAPASPVEWNQIEEEATAYAKKHPPFWASHDGYSQGVKDHCVNESKPSPVIEIGEQGEELAKVKEELLLCIRERNKYLYQLDTAADAKASHPAPAPIVGEREEEKMKCETCIHQLSDHDKEGSDVHCGKGHWYGLADPNTPYPADFDFWHNCEDFAPTNPAPAEQALPEEHPAVKSQKYIPNANVGTEAHPCAEYAAGLRKLLREAHGELAAANALIKEKQAWIDSHM